MTLKRLHESHEQATNDNVYLTFIHLISNKREWNSFVEKKNREILLNPTDFALQEQPEGNFCSLFSSMV